MGNIVILGAGVMGSALACVAAESNNVTLLGSPLDSHIIGSLLQGKPHPVLKHPLPTGITALHAASASPELLQGADVIVIGVSSPGVAWALETIKTNKASPSILALVTKGLVGKPGSQTAPETYAQTLDAQLTTPDSRIVGIGGPCIAREMALGYPTRVCFASHDITVANQLREMLRTNHYHIATHTDFTGLEACAALKNFMCIGVSTMFTAHPLDNGHAKNPLAGLFNQAVLEISGLCQWIKNDVTQTSENTALAASITQDLAFDLAGMGDLHVTVGGGRNSLLGRFLGEGKLLNDILQKEMKDTTVEGVDTARQLSSGFRFACEQSTLNATDFPLTRAILDVVEFEQPFEFDFSSLPD